MNSLFSLFTALSLFTVSYNYPLKNIKPTSLYGVRIHPVTKKSKLHQGIDLKADYGTSVQAVAYGKVIFSGNYQGYGNLISITHANGYTSHYAHLSKISVSIGQLVEPSQIIGEVGDTGITTGPHLHFELRKNGKSIDPSILIQMIMANNYEQSNNWKRWQIIHSHKRHE